MRGIFGVKLNRANSTTSTRHPSIQFAFLCNAVILCAADSSARVVLWLRLSVENSSLVFLTYRHRGDPMKCPEVARLGAILSALAAIFVFSAGDAAAGQFTVLHNFQANPAAYPQTGLIAGPDGSLYGTTAIQNGCPRLCGAVFELAKTASGWRYRVVHKFRGPQVDGEVPFGQLLLDNAGNLYGTTFSNGSSTCVTQHTDCGTVFMLSPTATGWAEKVLYRFTGGADGAFPIGNLLLDTAGNLYGTTLGGGSFNRCRTFGCGVVFELSPGSSSWTLNALYTFTGGNDGWRPDGLTFDVNGSLLGVSQFGGAFNSGTVFELTAGVAGWTESVLYTFTGGSDGAYPSSQLIFDSKGNLYGTASAGGLVDCSGSGCGTIFELSPNGSGWTFTDLYSFSGADGEFPRGVQFDPAGNLFGAAFGGDAGCQLGCGVLFKLAPGSGKWNETVLYKFKGTSDGQSPTPVILDAAGNLFGAAVTGGSRNLGTLFELTP
jgi:uncharacterized repeat protein (TIGR03803 family)